MSVAKFVKKLTAHTFPPDISRALEYIGVKNALQYLFFQRILRVNSHVPWPVHWSSVVSCPEKIRRRWWRPYPGYMPGQYIQAANGIEIGRNVRLGPGVKLISANHNLDNYDQHDAEGPIVIGDNCWIGANAIVLPGVRLGCHVVVGAGAVVTHDFGDNCLIAGVPARLIRSLGEYKGTSDW